MFSGFPEGLRANIRDDGRLTIEAKRHGAWVPSPQSGVQLQSADEALSLVEMFAQALSLDVHHLSDDADLGENYYLRPRQAVTIAG